MSLKLVSHTGQVSKYRAITPLTGRASLDWSINVTHGPGVCTEIELHMGHVESANFEEGRKRLAESPTPMSQLSSG